MEQRNMILAIVLSLLVLLGWNALFPPEGSMPSGSAVSESPAPSGAGTPEAPVTTEARKEEPRVHPTGDASGQPPAAVAQAASKRYTIENDVIRLTVDGRGWFVHGELKQYRESIEPGSPLVSVLKMGEKHSVFFNSAPLGLSMQTPFEVVEQGGDRIHLRARIEGGRDWDRIIALHPGSYVIDIRDTVSHGAGVKLYRQVVEKHPDRDKDTFYEHMGPTGFLSGKLMEPDYDELDEKGAIRGASMGGWTAIMDRYFIAAILGNPDQDYPYYFKSDGRSYQAGLIDDGKLEGDKTVYHARLFVGPKSIPLLKTIGVELERSVDFGWFAFIAKPMHSFLVWMYGYIGNYGWCIIALVLLIKLMFFWLTQKSYESMAAMRKLQPELVRLKELYGDDRQKMSQEMMKLYKKHKVNPMGGCLPILIQIPVFFALYKVLLISIEMRQAPFIGWIQDLSVQDPYFVLPVLMGVSMFVQQKLNPQPSDPMQAKVMQFLPFMFIALFLFFPAGLVLYWLVNNILSILQQWYVLKVKQAL